jgi:sulfur transfer protein SufE
MVDGKTAQEIKNMDLLSEFQSLNLNLGAGRLNGVNSMIRFLQNL